MIPSYFNWAEVLWLLLSTLGVALQVYNLWRSGADRKAMIASGERNGRLLIANFTIWRNRLGLWVLLLTFGVGVWGGYVDNQVVNVPATLAFISVVAALVAKAALDAALYFILDHRSHTLIIETHNHEGTHYGGTIEETPHDVAN